MYKSSREHESINLPASQSRQANSTSASCGFNPASRNASCLIEENNRHESTSPHSVSHWSLCILSLCASRFSDKAAQGYRRIHRPSLAEHFGKPQGIPDRGACLGVVEVGVYRDLPLERGAGQHGPGLEKLLAILPGILARRAVEPKINQRHRPGEQLGNAQRSLARLELSPRPLPAARPLHVMKHHAAAVPGQQIQCLDCIPGRIPELKREARRKRRALELLRDEMDESLKPLGVSP